MPTSPDGVQGLSEEEATKRFAEALEQADAAQRLAIDLAARVERAKSATLGRERSRLARKYGGESTEATRADVAMSTQGLVLEAAVAEAQRARIAVSPVDEKTTRVHGRARDRSGAGVAGIMARLLDARGKALVKAATDENGYFRLDVKPRGKAGPLKAAEAPTWTLVLARGARELARTKIEDLTRGEARYCELEVPDRSR